MRKYKCLNETEYKNGKFLLVPLRDMDKHTILKMRNEQIYHLRQSELLNVEKQDAYFKNVIDPLFQQEKPGQLLFSFLENGEFVGYGGLVHINWENRNAEISFIMKTDLENNFFSFYWQNYLLLIENVAFIDLGFHKIYTYAYDLRPHLYKVLLDSGYKEDARLKQHYFFEDKFIDIVINSKFNSCA